MKRSTPTNRTRVLTVHAPAHGELAVVLEPWGEIYEVLPGTSVLVTCGGAARDELDVTYEPRPGGAFLKLWAPENGTLEAEVVDARPTGGER